MNGMKMLTLLGLMVVGSGALASADEVPIVGGHTQLSGERKEQAITLLDTTLSQLATGDGPTYKAVNVTNVTSQVVAGTLYTYQVELDNGSDKKDCTVKIWTQPWLKENGTNIKIKCEGEDGELDRTW
ncbi:cystatin-like protein [Drosophila pseudoobscura]|uniref:Cystatin-like protein n=1 Tax=Drosophila pseudoobscura pseudoobscura TaxID=46245 RepID=A0A6I8UPL8_DROPS|nr:cystatin-like protein [Drosophila pseudoobscura]